MPLITHDYTALENVLCNARILEAMPQQLENYGYGKALILSANTLHQQTETVNDVVATLGDKAAAVFSKIRTHTPRDDVLTALAVAKQAEIDVIIAIGGGSIIDAAKAVQLGLNLNLTNADDYRQYAQLADGTRGNKTKTLASGDVEFSNAVRVIAVPTTLSGAEFSNTAGILDIDSGSKEGYRAPNLYPRSIIYDPEISAHTPEWLWLSTAIRSIDHAVEGYCSSRAYPYLEGQFLHALTLFADSLRAVKGDPSDLNARNLNQQAVWLACCGLGRVTHGASHGIGYILGSLCGVPHGYTSCVMLPAVLTWNAEINGERQRAIAKALGDETQTAGHQIKQLVDDLGLPTNLRAVGVKQHQLAEIAKRAAEHSVVQSNPRPVNSAADVTAILDLAW